MKKITLFSIMAVLFAALSFTSCNSSSDNTIQLPTQQEAHAMLMTVAGTHSCGILLPEDKNNKVEKDSLVDCTFRVIPSDSTFRITNFPVSKLSRYFANEDLAKAIANAPSQDLTGKLLPYSGTATAPFFCHYLNNITFKNSEGKVYTLAFYGGYYNTSIAGYASSKKNSTTYDCFLMYITLGAVYEGTSNSSSIVSGALKTSSYGTPYTLYLKYNL